MDGNYNWDFEGLGDVCLRENDRMTDQYEE
jgi:hypothetical protein